MLTIDLLGYFNKKVYPTPPNAITAKDNLFSSCRDLLVKTLIKDILHIVKFKIYNVLSREDMQKSQKTI